MRSIFIIVSSILILLGVLTLSVLAASVFNPSIASGVSKTADAVSDAIILFSEKASVNTFENGE